MSLPSSSSTSVVYNWNYTALVLFVCRYWSLHPVSWRYLRQFWSNLQKNNFTLNSANFSTCTSDMMDELNWWNPIFAFGFPYLGLLMYGGWDPQKAYLRSIRFPSVPLAYRILVIPPLFSLWLWQESPLARHLQIFTEGVEIHCIRVMLRFRY